MTCPPDGWYGTNQVVHMLDFLQRQGEVAIVSREGRHRRWDLAERVYPQDSPVFDFKEAERMLAEHRLQAVRIAKKKSPWSGVGEAGELATVEGSKWKFRVDPEAIASLDEEEGGRVALLNPYDSMLFDRPRLKELFEFEYILEQFKPKPQRKYGFFAHPILMGDRFVGMLDAEVDRAREVLTVNAVHELLPFDAEEDEMVRAEIGDLGEWLGVVFGVVKGASGPWHGATRRDPGSPQVKGRVHGGRPRPARRLRSHGRSTDRGSVREQNGIVVSLCRSSSYSRSSAPSRPDARSPCGLSWRWAWGQCSESGRRARRKLRLVGRCGCDRQLSAYNFRARAASKSSAPSCLLQLLRGNHDIRTCRLSENPSLPTSLAVPERPTLRGRYIAQQGEVADGDGSLQG